MIPAAVITWCCLEERDANVSDTEADMLPTFLRRRHAGNVQHRRDDVQPPEPDDARTCHVNIVADYHQVYLDDCPLADELTWVQGR